MCALRRVGVAADEWKLPEPLSVLPLFETCRFSRRRQIMLMSRTDATGKNQTQSEERLSDNPPVSQVRYDAKQQSSL